MIDAHQQFDALNMRRQEAQIGVKRLLAMASVKPSVWQAYRKKRRVPRPTQLRKLERALKQIEKGHRPNRRRELVRGLYLVNLAAWAVALELDARRCICAQVEDWGEWLYATEARRQAIYGAVIFFDIPAHEVAAAANVSRAAVSKILNEVEEIREDPGFDEKLDRFEKMVAGHG